MTYKWIGAALVIAACSGFGFTMASAHMKNEKQLRQMLLVLEDMECLLQYKLMPLPELCRSAANRINGPVRSLIQLFSQELERQIAPDVPTCMSAALSQCQNLNGNVRYLFSELGHSLGSFDLAGQVKSLEYVKNNCYIVLKHMESNRELRIKCYQTLGICAGVALAIILI